MERIELLKKTGIFNSLTDKELEKVASYCEELKCEMGHQIFGEDRFGVGLYIIEEGEIIISFEPSLEDTTGISNEQFLTTLGPGECFGEVSLLDGGIHSASAKALSDCKMLFLSEKAFNKLVEEDKHIGFIIAKNIGVLLSQRLRNANFMIKLNA